MLARHPLPESYDEWNAQWGAPSGFLRRVGPLLPRRVERGLRTFRPQVFGPFGFQVNNATRTFEFPWAYFEIAPRPGLRVLEIGGSLAGLQFALAKAGAQVVNVDPGEAATGRGWPVDQRNIDRLNRAFDTNVALRSARLQDIHLPSDSFDVVCSISTIEHIPKDEHRTLMQEIGRVLAPGGRCVLTIDLFLSLSPFTNVDINEWGSNVDVRQLVAWSGRELAAGDKAQLYGYEEFETEAVLATLDNTLFGFTPACAQCLVLQ